jgi:hypothetical protein
LSRAHQGYRRRAVRNLWFMLHGNIDSCGHPKYESKIRLVAKQLMFEVCFA